MRHNKYIYYINKRYNLKKLKYKLMTQSKKIKIQLLILINLRVRERQNVWYFVIVTKFLFLLAKLLCKSNHD